MAEKLNTAQNILRAEEGRKARQHRAQDEGRKKYRDNYDKIEWKSFAGQPSSSGAPKGK